MFFVRRTTTMLLTLNLACIGIASAATPVAKLNVPAVAGRLDALLAEELPDAKSTAVKRVDDEAFVRRAYLDVVGEWPTAAELTAYVLDPSPNKKAELVDRLLADKRFGTNWGRYWRDVVLYRRAEERALITAGAATQFLSEKLNAGAPWSEIATALITATGNIAEEGSTVLISAQMGDANEVASEVSRIFMGIQISCAQCHDHPTDRWKRQQFHELAAFFPRVAVRPVLTEGRVRGFEAVSRDFAPRFGFGGNMPNNPRNRPIEHYMPDLKDPASQGKLMQPVFFATKQKLGEAIPDQERRHALAEYLTSKDNPWFAKAFVNRIWGELVGEGFYEPVDDMGPDRPCSAPKTLDHLATAFADSGYDVRQVYRTIMATDAYARESRPQRNPDDAPFAANCLHRIRGDQLFDSLMNALGLPAPDESRAMGYGGGRALLGSPRSQFNQTFGYDPSSKREEITGSIPQALLMMNSPYVATGIDGQSARTTLGKLLAEETNDEAVAVELYLRCLAREPNKQELTVCLDHVKTTGNRTEAFEDILWSIVNSTEFLHRQ